MRAQRRSVPASATSDRANWTVVSRTSSMVWSRSKEEVVYLKWCAKRGASNALSIRSLPVDYEHS